MCDANGDTFPPLSCFRFHLLQRYSLNANIICYLLSLFILLIIFTYALGAPPSYSLRVSVALLYFSLFSFFISSFRFSYSPLAILYSVEFAILPDIASRSTRKARPSADWLRQTLSGLLETNGKFSIRNDFLLVLR